jgi:phage terminase large subunit
LSDCIKTRLQRAREIRGNPRLQRIELAKCKADPVYWINTWVWTYDPRRDDLKRLPMILFPRQEEYIRWRRERYAKRESFVVEKSRDVGLTWLNAADKLHHWLFDQDYKGTFGSRKEALVDKLGDPDSIFFKLRFMLENLPGWMQPEGFNRKKHDNFLRLVNPANGSTITGEAGDNMGRGGRSSDYDCDEWAFVERADTVDSAISANSDCIGYTSTAHGQGNNFHRKATEGKLPKFTFHWRDDPRKDQAWYDKQVETLDPIVVAQEIDIDYAASVEGILINRGWVENAWARSLHEAERGAIIIGADIAEAGSDKCAAVVREGRNILHLDEWHDPEQTLSAGRLIALGKDYETRLQSHHKLYLFIDTIGVGSGVAGELRNWITENRQGKWFLIGVKASESSPEDKCKRLRDALWWRMRQWFRAEEPAGELPRALRDKLTNELSSITYRPDSSGLVVVESKADLQKRGIKSPNLADALMHTFYVEAMKPQESETDRLFGKRRKEQGSWMSR